MAEARASEETHDEPLRRGIGFTGSAFLAFNGAVGAGIFALPGALAADFGAFSPWLFPLFGLLALAIVLPLARLASHFPQSGGPVAYTAGFGPLVSFQVGWIYYVARVTALAANANVFAAYAAGLWTPLGAGAGRAASILALIALLATVNLLGVRRAIRALDAVTLLKALPVLGFAIAGLVLFADRIPPPGPLPPLSGIEAAALLVLYAFVGFENSLVPAGETRDARRTVPRALVAPSSGPLCSTSSSSSPSSQPSRCAPRACPCSRSARRWRGRRERSPSASPLCSRSPAMR